MSVGNLLVFSDLADADQGPAVELDKSTGAVVASYASLPNAGRGAILPSGTFAIGVEQLSGTKLSGVGVYSASLSQIALVTSVTTTPMRWSCPVVAWGEHTFYFIGEDIASPTTPTISTISDTGVVGGTTWTPTFATLPRAAAVNLAGTILYTGGANAGFGDVYRYDLINNIFLSSLVTGTAFNFIGTDFFVTSADDLCLCYETAAGADWEFRRYNSSGVLQTSFSIGPNLWGDEPEMCSSGDPDLIWVRTFPDVNGFTTRFRQFRISTNAVVQDWTVNTLQGGGNVPVTCPFFELRGFHRGIYVPTRGVAGSEGGGGRARFADLDGYVGGAGGTLSGRIIAVLAGAESTFGGAGLGGASGGRRAMYVPTIGISGAEGDGRQSSGATVGVRRIVVYDGEGYTHR